MLTVSNLDHIQNATIGRTVAQFQEAFKIDMTSDLAVSSCVPIRLRVMFTPESAADSARCNQSDRQNSFRKLCPAQDRAYRQDSAERHSASSYRLGECSQAYGYVFPAAHRFTEVLMLSCLLQRSAPTSTKACCSWCSSTHRLQRSRSLSLQESCQPWLMKSLQKRCGASLKLGSLASGACYR